MHLVRRAGVVLAVDRARLTGGARAAKRAMQDRGALRRRCRPPAVLLQPGGATPRRRLIAPDSFQVRVLQRLLHPDAQSRERPGPAKNSATRRHVLPATNRARRQVSCTPTMSAPICSSPTCSTRQRPTAGATERITARTRGSRRHSTHPLAASAIPEWWTRARRPRQRKYNDGRCQTSSTRATSASSA